MEEDLVDFYSQERWDNWLDRLAEADLDDEEETSRLYLNLQNDAAIAVAKVLKAYQEESLTDEEAIDELTDIQTIVLDDPSLEDEDQAVLLDAVQTSLVSVFMAAERYLLADEVDDIAVTGHLDAALEAEAEERFEESLAYISEIGVHIIDGNTVDMSLMEELEYGLVTEWLGGLDSLQEAMQGPKVVEE